LLIAPVVPVVPVPVVPAVPVPPDVTFACVSMNSAELDERDWPVVPVVPVPVVPAAPPAMSAFSRQPVTVTCWFFCSELCCPVCAPVVCAETPTASAAENTVPRTKLRFIQPPLEVCNVQCATSARRGPSAETGIGRKSAWMMLRNE